MTAIPPRRVVLVDDDASLRRALARVLHLSGYRVETFASADEFMRARADGDDACLVLDINLPHTSGVELRRTLAALGQNPPTIFITALDREDAAAALAPLGPMTVLFKPFDNDALLTAIHQIAAEAASPGTVPQVP